MNGIGRRIIERRTAVGLTQRELAQPGVSYAYISRLEHGARNPSVKALRLIAPALGVSVHWLETGEPDPLEVYVEAARLLIAADLVSVGQWEQALVRARIALANGERV